ncbi:MAG: ROK family transcriptional regulator [Bryobacteraceae bacterium]|nr:ROK family transcriptional regulator [Bryobacteraceae bacterium]
MRGVTLTARGALNRSALREANERLVLNTIRRNPRISRADIVRITGLGPSSVTYIVDRLVRNELIREEETDGRTHVGRTPTALGLRPEARMAIAVEIDRPDSKIALVDLNGDIVRKKTVRWHSNSELLFERIRAAIRSLADPLQPGQMLGVGVGLPGTLDRASGQVIAAENFGWFGLNAGTFLRRDLSFQFHFENAAQLSALSEMWISERESRPLQNFVFVAARGGIGTGVIIKGQLFQGAHSSAAEFGHTTLYPDGRRCTCGNTGCWEQYSSDVALCRLYTELGGKNGVEPNAAAIIKLAREGDSFARRAIEETAGHTGLGFANLIWALDPEAIVAGDWMVEAWDLIEAPIWNVVRQRVAGYYLSGLRILPSRNSRDWSLLGAAALVLGRFFNRAPI